MTKSLLLFAGIALFVGAFIIANTLTMLVAQRSREIALLRAIGASRRQVVRSMLIEAVLLGTVASGAKTVWVMWGGGSRPAPDWTLRPLRSSPPAGA